MGSLLFGAAMRSSRQFLTTCVSDHGAQGRRQGNSPRARSVFPRASQSSPSDGGLHSLPSNLVGRTRGRDEDHHQRGLIDSRVWRWIFLSCALFCAEFHVRFDTIARAPALSGPSHILTFVVEPLTVLSLHLLHPLHTKVTMPGASFPQSCRTKGSRSSRSWNYVTRFNNCRPTVPRSPPRFRHDVPPCGL